MAALGFDHAVTVRTPVAWVIATVLSACAGADNQTAPPTTSRATNTARESTAPVPQIEEPPPTGKSLLGTWSRIGTAGLIRFGKDGEFRVARNESDLTDAPFASGTYELDGNTVTLAGGCNSVWEAGVADGELHVVVIQDQGCGLSAGLELSFVRIARR
jgi:hypothetical protein